MKKRNEDNPDIREDNSEELSAEALGFINRLLERLHQADFTNHGSKIEVVYVASGGQHVETQINVGADHNTPLGKEKDAEPPTLPETLSSEAAMAQWEKVQKAGYVDDNYQPTISRTQAALLADAMAERLGIKEKWKVFEALWNRKYMRSDYNLALTQQQSLDFQDELKSMFK